MPDAIGGVNEFAVRGYRIHLGANWESVLGIVGSGQVDGWVRSAGGITC